MNSTLAHQIWLSVQRPEYKRFINACQDPFIEQTRILKSYIQENAQTEFGATHYFGRIQSYEDFAREVPIREYSDFQQWITKIANGEQNILTKCTVIGFEETSGTTSFTKLIPYTSKLKEEFEKGVAAWLVSLQHSYPHAFQGSAYWALSPATKPIQKTNSGLPIGIEDDKEYFNPFVGWLLSSIMAVPASLKKEKNAQKFYLESLKSLLIREDLSFISVWSPTFFLQLDDSLKANKEKIVNWLNTDNKISKDRRKHIITLFESNFVWKDIWPKLSVISCWKDAQSEWWITEVQKRAGHVWIQGKGLLSTEGITSIPIDPQLDPVLSIRSHFYEFKSLNNSKVCLAHELSKGEIYEVILTTAGGLCRYASGDLIEVTGFFKNTPTFRFVGRNHQQSDLVGEKLSEHQVLESLRIALKDSIKVNLAFFYPTQAKTRAGYTLFIEKNGTDYSAQDWEDLISNAERLLSQNPYYQQAVNIGQLDPLKIAFLPTGFRDRLVEFLKVQTGGKESTVKVPVLFTKNRLKPLLDV